MLINGGDFSYDSNKECLKVGCIDGTYIGVKKTTNSP